MHLLQVKELVVCWSMAGLGGLSLLYGLNDTIRGKVEVGTLTCLAGLLVGAAGLFAGLILAVTWHN